MSPAVSVIGLVVFHDLLELLQVLHFLDQKICSVVGFTQKRGDLRVQDLSGLVDVFLGIRVPRILNVHNGLIEVSLVRVLVQVQELHVPLKVLPVAHVPG